MRNWGSVVVVMMLGNGTMFAQVADTDPAASAVTPVAPATAASSAAAPAASSTRNLWSFLIPSASQKQAFKEKLC